LIAVLMLVACGAATPATPLATQPPATDSPVADATSDAPDLLSTLIVQPTANPNASRRVESVLTVTYTRSNGETQQVPINFIIDLPPGYDDSTRNWPMLIYLHGAGQHGSDINLIRTILRPLILQDRVDEFPFIMLIPQCPCAQGGGWGPFIRPLDRMIDEVSARYRVDSSRVYLVGYSDGGFGAWAFGVTYPQRFAAVAMIAGYFLSPEPPEAATQDVCNKLKDKPIWLFHGEDDQIIPLRDSQTMVDILQGCDGNVTLSSLPGVDHFSIVEQVLSSEALYQWLLEHTLED
jgi:predicted peptidase